MADIVKAIEMEKEYLAYRMKNEEPFHLVDAIKKCGFKSVEEYLEVKSRYEFRNLKFEVIETTSLQAIPDVLDTIAQKKTAVLFSDTEFNLIWNGNGSEYDEDYCVENNIVVIPMQTGGGTMVATKEDIQIGFCIPQSIGITGEYILQGLVRIFRKYTNKNVEVNGNDVLIDGYKVLGAAMYNAFGMFACIVSVSMSDKSDLISKICLKEQIKVPNYIDFMTREQLRQEVSQWLKVNSI